MIDFLPFGGFFLGGFRNGADLGGGAFDQIDNDRQGFARGVGQSGRGLDGGYGPVHAFDILAGTLLDRMAVLVYNIGTAFA